MRKTILLLALAALAGVAAPVASHEPSRLTLSFDPGSRNLRISVTHDIAGSDDRFVDRIDIFVDGGRAETLVFDGESRADSFHIDYTVEDATPEHILVVAHCGRHGTIEEDLFVGDRAGPGVSEERARSPYDPPPEDTDPRDIRAPSDMGSRDMAPGFGGDQDLYDPNSMRPGFRFRMDGEVFDSPEQEGGAPQ